MRRYLMLLILCVPAAANAQEFTYNPSGELTPAGVGFLMGLAALLAHTVGHGLQDATRSRA